MRYIDYPRERNYDIKKLLSIEITSTSFFFTKDYNCNTSKAACLKRLQVRIIKGTCKVYPKRGSV